MRKTALLIAGFPVGESGHGVKEHRGLGKKKKKTRKWILLELPGRKEVLLTP